MNQLMRFEDLREWLMSQIDGSEETRGDDSLISHFIRQIDALPSEMGTIPTAEREKVMEAHRLAATVEPKGCPTPGACSCPGTIPDVDAGTQLVRLTAEVADLKQRLLPQFQGRAQRAEHERDGMLEQLIVHRTTIANLHSEIASMRNAARSATEPVAWMYEEAGEKMFGHPDGYRPKDAVPLYAAPVEEGATRTRNAALEEAARVCDAGVDGAGRPYAEAIRALKQPDRPDWAQQLPGAEIFDRSNMKGEQSDG